MFKKIFLGLLVLFVLALGGLTYYISNMDWNSYKRDIADKFSEVTGKEIDFGGKINISLFPQPIMTANNISVFNQGENKKPLATIEKMEMEVPLLSLIQGAPDVDSLSLSGAQVWVEQFENGSINWKNPQGNGNGVNEDKKTSLRSLSLQNASFHYENKSANIKFDLDKINAEVQANAYDGPYRLDGNFTKGGDHFAIAVGVGSLASLDGIEVNLSIAHPASDSSFRFDGTYSPQDHNIKGDFSGGSKKTAQIVNTLAETNLMTVENQQELQFSSGVEADENLIKLSSFVTKYGNDIEGSGSINYPLSVAEGEKRQIDLKYEFLNFNIEQLVSVAKAKYAEFEKNGGEYLPDTDFNVKADLAAKRLDFSNDDMGYLENVTLKANWTDNVLTLEEFFAAGAGDTSISVSGDLREENMKPHYFLKNSVISNDFLSFANALGANLHSYVQSSYHNAEFDFSILGDNENLRVENAILAMDKMKLNADFSTSFAADVPSFELKIDADMLNFDNYLKNDEEKGNFLAKLEEDFKQTEFLKKYNFKLDIAAANAIFRSTLISSLIIKAENNQGLLTFEEVSMHKIAGADINIVGGVDLLAETPEFKNLKTDIKTANVADLISQIDFKLPTWKMFKTKMFELSSTINGSLNELQVQAVMNSDGVVFNYDGQIKNPNSDAQMNGYLSVKTTNIGQFFEALNLDIKNLPNRSGALNCSGNADIKTGAFSYQQAKCSIGSADYAGDVYITRQDERNNVKAMIESDEFNLAYLFELNQSKTANFVNENTFDNTFIAKPDLSRDTINFDMYKNADYDLDITAKKAVLKRLAFDDVHFKLSNKDNAIKIEEIKALYKNALYVGEMTLSYANPDAPELKGNLRFSDFDIGLLGGSTYMFNNGKINGNTAFETKGINAYELFSNVSGYISMTVENLNFKGFNFSAINKDIAIRKYSKGLFQAIRDNLQQGETEFDPFDVTIAMKNGNLTVANQTIVNQYANTDISFDVNLKEWKINSKITVSLLDVGEVPPFEISLNGMLQKPTLEINIEQMVRRYDDKAKQVEEQEKAKQEALRAELATKMETAQQKVSNLSKKINSYSSTIEDYKAKSKKDENIEWYSKKLAQIGYINEDLDKMKAKSHTPDFSDNDITLINEKIENYEHDISMWDEEMNKRYLEDLDVRFNKLLNIKSNADIKVQELKSAYDTAYAKEFVKLEEIEQQDSLTSDKEIKTKKDEIEKINSELDSLGAELDKRLIPLNTLTDVAKKDQALLNAEEYAKLVENKLLQLQNVQDNLISDLKKLSETLQAQYAAEQQQNQNEISSSVEIKQENNSATELEKPRENSISKKENSLLKEISDERKAAEFLSEEANSAQGVIVRKYDANSNNVTEKVEQKSGLLKEVDGAIRKASGTIILK